MKIEKEYLELKDEGFTFEEIQDVIETEKDYEINGISYSLDEAFSLVKEEIFSKKNKENA